MLRAAETRPPLPVGFFDEVGRITLRVSRAVRDVRTWRPVLLDQMVVLGVDSVPIAIFLAVFTGIVLALLASYIFTNTVPLYFVGSLVGKTMMMELAPVLTGHGAGRPRWRQHRRRARHHEGDRAGRRARDPVLRSPGVSGRAPCARRDAHVPRRHRLRHAVGVISGWLTASTFILELPAQEFVRACGSSTSSRTSGTAW